VAPPGPISFYVYRAQSDRNYPLANHNAADLAGVLWYLHNEIMGKTAPGLWSTSRKYDITRILRFKITSRTTEAFYNACHKQFGPFVALDYAMCTAANCDDIWAKYGFVVGCQNLGRDIANYVQNFDEVPRGAGLRGAAAMGGEAGLRGGVWYSLPGPCPSMKYGEKSASCNASQPGGECELVTGAPDCTFRVEFAGEVALDELCGIKDYRAFRKAGDLEYVDELDHGVNCDFWDGKLDLQNCTRRLRRVQQLFAKKNPSLPASLPTPAC